MAADRFASAAIRAVSPDPAATFERMAQLRDTLDGVRGQGTQGPQGAGDAARGITIDIGKGSEGASFRDTLARVINQVSDAQDAASDSMQRFINGEPVELHEVMASAEQASISLELLVELKNKFTEAYRSVMSMQS